MNQDLISHQKRTNHWWKKWNETANYSGGRKLINSLWSIFLGLLIAALVIWNKGVDPYNFIKSLVIGSFQHLPQFIVQIAIFGLAATAVGLSFKSGLFNIGVSGKMMGAGIVTMLYLLGIKSATFIHLLISLGLAMLTAMLIGALIGLLKAYFNLHEVLSSILLNWIIYYLGKYAFGGESPYANDTKDASKIVPHVITDFSTIVQINNSYWFWLALLIVMIIAIGIGVSSKTTIGYKIKITGLNPNAASYAGVNQKRLIVGVMTFGGFLSGIAGWIYYLVLNNGVYSISGGPISAGFDAIAVSLLAYNNPIGIIFSSTFYSTLEPGFIYLQLHIIPLAFQKIILGLIIYFSALSLLFSRFQVLKMIWQYCRLIIQKKYRQHCYSYYAKRWIVWKKHCGQMIRVYKKRSIAISTNKRIKELKRKINTHIDWKQVAKLNDQEKLLYFYNKKHDQKIIIEELELLGWKWQEDYRNHYQNQVQSLKQEHLLIKADLIQKNHLEEKEK